MRVPPVVGVVVVGVVVALLWPAAVHADADVLRTLFSELSGRGGFPADLRVTGVEPVGGGWRVALRGDFEGAEWARELRVEQVVGALSAAGVEGGVTAFVNGEPLGGIATPEVARPTLALPRSPLRPRGEGPLAGRRIAVSAGHGWIDDGGWRTQRVRWAFEGCGSCRGITEDFFSAEVTTRYVIPLLQRMGAEVVLVREPDHSEAPAQIVDDQDPGYAEVGAWAAGNSGGGHRDTYRSHPAEGDGEARFDFEISGWRRVAFRWREGGNRAPDALLRVEHLGGVAELRLDQRRPGQHWLDLGAYAFGPGAAAVTLSHGSGEGVLIADAVKLGGGRFEPADKPMWQMAAKTYVRLAGAPASVTDRGDVTIRPAYAEHIGADAYVSIHANASGREGGSGANGLSTYRYNCQQYGDHSPSRDAVNCDDPPGSRALAEGVQAAILERLRADWDPAYGDRGTRVANFGELRVLDETPGALIESGFFDNLANPTGGARYPDNRSLHDPRWREAFALGLVTGVARYFDPNAVAPPGRPAAVVLRNGEGGLRASWRAVPGAVAYRLYTALSGRAWDDGRRVEGLSAQVPAAVGALRAVRVAAIGPGGEGFASQAILARAGVPRALLVWAYDRRDAWVQAIDNDLQGAVEHTLPVPFDGALDEAVGAEVQLGDYALVDFAAGKDSTADAPLDAAQRAALRAYVEAGGALILSGEEIGYALVETSDDPAEAAFLEQVMGARYVADDADTYDLVGVGEGVFSGLEVHLDDGSQGTYEVRFPDVYAPVGAGRVALQYPDGSAAAIVTPRTALLGAGLEAVVPNAARAALMQALVLHLLGADEPVPPLPDAGPLPPDASPLRDAAVSAPEADGGALAPDADAPVVRLGPDAAGGEPGLRGGGTPPGTSASASDGGCGCGLGDSAPAPALLALLALVLAAPRRR
jgi:MYXO-CTERM domain-containing protein